MPAPTIENAVQGQVPGALIQQNNGGAPAAGCRSRSAESRRSTPTPSPLYVLDGVIVNNETINPGNNAITSSADGRRRRQSDEDLGANRIADINPDDIESIEILKGASASAIYGSKASAGRRHHHDQAGHAGKPRGASRRRSATSPMRKRSPSGSSRRWRARRRGT